jgi:Bcr/CflA subfamily drug resistance transporter
MECNKKTTLSAPIFLIVVLAAFPLLSETIYTPSLPNIANSLNVSSHLVEWTLSIYFIGYAFGISLWGRISDLVGRRRAAIIGVCVYIVGGILCLLSQNIPLLLLSRLVLAFGASIGSIMAQTLARESFEGSKRREVYTLVIMALTAVPATGPFIGGFIVYLWSWKGNFIFLLILGLSLLVTLCLKLPETNIPSKNYHTKIPWIAVALRLSKDPRAIISALMVGFLNGLLHSYYAESPFIFINVIGIHSYQYGFLGVAIALATLTGGLISYQLNRKSVPGHKLILLGFVIMFLSALLFVYLVFLEVVPSSSNILMAIASIILPVSGIFVGAAISLPNILSNALIGYDEALGTAGSLFSFSYYMIVALATFLMGFMHNGTLYPMPIYFLIITGLLCITNMLFAKRYLYDESYDLLEATT